tara:strand:- start:210 stop:2129 length:1920 start_codon:yes stop_codon:yes gene_type:complete
MAIEDTYNLLSAGIKADKKKERKRQEKDELKGLLVKGVVGIGNSMLKDNATKFLESEQFYKENMQFKKGHAIANEYVAQEKLARADKLGYDSFWARVAPADRVDAAMTEKYGAQNKYNISDWKDMRTTLMQDIGTDARKNHEEGLVQAQSFINQSGDEGEDFYASYAKKSRPTTISGLITSKTKQMLGGEDLNVVTRESTRKRYLGSAQALVAYDKAWDETGDNKISKFFADTSKKLGGAAPIIKEDFEDLGGTDSLGNELGKVKVYKATYWDGSEKYVTPNGDTFTPEKARIHKQYNNWVAQNLGTTEAAKSNQAIGELALASHATNEERDFFIAHSKTIARKSVGTNNDKALAKANRETAASIAGLKLIYTGRDYGLSEREGSRLAVAMHKKVIESRQAQRESNVLGANPYDFSNVLGTALVMVEQQSVAERATDFTPEDIKEFISSPENLRAMFEDYDELTPDALKAYGNLVEEAGDPYLSMAHKRMERFINISETKNTKDLKEIYKYYQAEQMALPITAPTLAQVESTITAPVVPEIVPISKLVKPAKVTASRPSSFNPVSGGRYSSKTPTQLDAYNKLLALQTVTQRKKQRADESTASLKPEFRDRLGTPQKASMKSIAELQEAYKDYITKYGE